MRAAFADITIFTGTRFAGDGRQVVAPQLGDSFPGTTPKPVTRGIARLIIEQFLESKISTHSVSMSTAWIIFEYCRAMDIAIRWHAVSNQGAVIEREAR